MLFGQHLEAKKSSLVSNFTNMYVRYKAHKVRKMFEYLEKIVCEFFHIFINGFVQQRIILLNNEYCYNKFILFWYYIDNELRLRT